MTDLSFSVTFVAYRKRIPAQQKGFRNSLCRAAALVGRWCQDLTFYLRDHTVYPGRKRKPEIDSERDTATYMAPTVISAARFCLPLGQRKSCQVQSKEQNRAERGKLEPRIIVTSWYYGGADLAKSIPRIEGSKCGSPPFWFEGNRFRPLVAIKPFG